MTQIKVKLNPDVTPAGSDLSVVNAARRSFNTRSEWDMIVQGQVVDGPHYENLQLKEKDKRLLEFLARGMTAADFEQFKSSIADSVYQMNDSDFYPETLVEKLWQWRNTPTHDTPFNHTFISFEVKMPVFTARQLVKTEYTILSEASRRYITDGIEFYEPPTWRKASPNKKQGSLDEAVDVAYYDRDDGYNDWPTDVNTVAMEAYTEMLKLGVAPEQARMVLPQSMMIEATWSGTLGAFAKMCRERCHPEAQYEARVVANKVYEYLKEYYPVGAVALVGGV